MVSIMPGIDTGAPERTDTSNGSFASPKRLPVICSSRRIAADTSSRSAVRRLASAQVFADASHAIVNPGGTGTPRLVISARLAPLPPSTSAMSRVPSAWPLAKK